MEHNICDVHMHILPDVDDGATCVEDSIKMIHEALRHGITSIFTTSHSFAYIDQVESERTYQIFQELRIKVNEMELPIQLYLGCEILCMYRWMPRIIRALESGQFPSMNHTKYVLIEFTMWNTTKEEAEHCASLLLNAGWIPVFAHIERFASSFADFEFVKSMREKGCLFQSNLFSLIDEPSDEIRTFCQELIARELIDFVGTDAHNMHHRPPKYEQGLTYLKEHCSDSYLSSLLHGNAEQYFL